jgi:hypothetical protein
MNENRNRNQTRSIFTITLQFSPDTYSNQIQPFRQSIDLLALTAAGHLSNFKKLTYTQPLQPATE